MDKIIKNECNSLCNQLKNKRKELGYTQREVAEKAGVPQSTVARLEKGSLCPRIDTLINIGSVLGLKIVFTDFTNL